MQPQPSGGDQGQTAKALYDYQAGKYGDKLENTTPSALEVLENRKIRKMLICEVLWFPPKFPGLYINLLE